MDDFRAMLRLTGMVARTISAYSHSERWRAADDIAALELVLSKLDISDRQREAAIFLVQSRVR